MAEIPKEIEAVINCIDRQKDYALLPRTDAAKDKYDAVLKKLFPNYQVNNITEFDYGRSFRYDIYLTENKLAATYDKDIFAQAIQQEGKMERIWLAISAIAPYAYIQFVQHLWPSTKEIDHLSYEPLSEKQNQALSAILKFLETEGIHRIEKAVALTIIPDIATDLHDKGTVRVQDCLFFG